VNRVTRSRDECRDLLKADLAGIQPFASAFRPKARVVHGEDDCLKNRRVRGIERAVDEYVVFVFFVLHRRLLLLAGDHALDRPIDLFVTDRARLSREKDLPTDAFERRRIALLIDEAAGIRIALAPIPADRVLHLGTITNRAIPVPILPVSDSGGAILGHAF